LGGTWEKAGDIPEESNPDISGYEPQMTIEALEELAVQIEKKGGSQSLSTQITAAIAHIETF
jgi:hypothetical protein